MEKLLFYMVTAIYYIYFMGKLDALFISRIFSNVLPEASTYLQRLILPIFDIIPPILGTQRGIHELPQELSNGLELRILGDQDISRKSLKWLELMASTQLAIQKTKLDSFTTKLRKIGFKTFPRKIYFT